MDLRLTRCILTLEQSGQHTLNMAIAITSVTSSIGDADQINSVTVASGEILVVCVGIHQGTVVAVKWNGTTITKGPVSATAFGERVEIWYSLTPEVGTFNVLFDGTTGSGRGVCIYTLSGVNASGQPNNTAGSSTGSSAESSVSITPSVDNCLIIDAHYSEDAFTTVGAGQTQRAKLQGNDSYEDFASSTTQQTSAAAESMTWTINSGQRWAAAAIAFAPATAGSSIKTVNGLTYASVKTVNGLAIASVKSINGLT